MNLIYISLFTEKNININTGSKTTFKYGSPDKIIINAGKGKLYIGKRTCKLADVYT